MVSPAHKLKLFVSRIRTYFLVSVLLATMGIGTVRVGALDEVLFSGSNILYYDPGSSCVVGEGEGTNVLVGNDNFEKTLRYYVGRGLTLAQASGIASNFSFESGLNPHAIGGAGENTPVAPSNYTPVAGTGFGIAQWEDASRQQGLANLAESNDKATTDLLVQLDYSWQELTSTHANALGNLKSTAVANDAAYVFYRDYTDSPDESEANIRAVRGEEAINLYTQYTSVVPDASSTPTASKFCTSYGSPSTFVDNFAIYNQYDPQWKDLPYGISTIGDGGCGPSAMAMIITALLGRNVTPADTASYGAANGTLYRNGEGGSYHNLHTVIGEHWGLSASTVGSNVAAINQGLRDGGLVLISGKGSAPFTAGGHFLVIRAVTADGKWLLGDSNGPAGVENSKREWSPESMTTNMANAWLLTK